MKGGIDGRRFNTAGPCVPSNHYMISALSRLPEAPALVDLKAFFAVHAPRQTGKTTAIRALAEELTSQNRYAAVAFSCEAARAAGDDYGVTAGIPEWIKDAARWRLPPELRPPAWPEAPPTAQLGRALSAWAEACPRPLVLFFDEIDAVRGESLLGVLGQLRDGYTKRSSAPFPWSVVLCGLRDVRDYKAASDGDPARPGASSPFTIKMESLRLDDLTLTEVAELYGQHTADTGQRFAAGVVEHAYELTGGQTWLVNALALEVVEKIGVPLAETIRSLTCNRRRNG